MEDENPFTKAQTIDPEVRAYVYSLVNALGGTSGDIDGRYVLGDDAIAVLRDLKRWLKLYDEKTNRLDVARCLAEAKLVTGDLLPILASWPEDGNPDKLRARTALSCLELLVPLTWPLENGEMTVNHHRHTPYLQQAQVLYKAGILNWDNTTILRQIIRIGLPSIAMQRDERTTRDEGIIKLMLYFLRNVTVIRQVPNLPSQGLENEISRSSTIDAFREQDVFAVLLTMCSNMGEDFNLQDVIILEILFNMIKGVDVEKLWMTEAQRKGKDVFDLTATLNEEKSLHKEAKKSAPSRHGKFGTMIWLKREGDKMSAVSGQDNIRDSRTTLLNIDKSKKWSKPQQKRKDMDHTIHDFDRRTQINSQAGEKLRNFVEEFLDSGFNPLFTHLRKAIEREAERMLDINYRQFFYVVAWFLQAERCRRTKQKREVKPTNLTSDFGAESFGIVAAVLNQETFITLNRYMETSLDNKEWQDLNACMRCFTQILLTVQEMAQSPLDEDQEIADNIQNRIFYEETTHDRLVSILKGYKDQGFGYLDACTELSHVFLRMLERYSKENADLQIRSRRRAARRKKKEARKQQVQEREEIEDENDASENEDIEDVAQVSRERKFDFKRFAAKFTSQSSVDTFVAFTSFYRELNVEQLKRAHRFFYRVAFKQELAVLLYRVDIVALFYKMIHGPEGLPRKHAMYADYSELSKQLFRKMFKKLEERPELLVELLFSKINKTLFYLEYGHEKITTASIRAPADLEVKPSAGCSKAEQIGIVVTVLLKDEKSDLVSWVKNILKKAFDERHAWEAEAEARNAIAMAEMEKEGDQTQSGTNLTTAVPSYITVRPTSTDIANAMFKNARLKLLMRLVGFEILGLEDVVDATWIIPGTIKAGQLSTSVSTIEKFEQTLWQGDQADDMPEDMLKRVRNQQHLDVVNEDEQARRDDFIDDSEGDENIDLNDEILFPDNIRETSKRRNIIEELKAKRRQKRKSMDDSDNESDGMDEEGAARRRKAREAAALEKRRKIKSELYIRDSDDETDEERDREFFVREEENRKKHAAKIKGLMAVAREEVEKTKKNNKKQQEPKRKRKKSRHNSSHDSEEEDEEDDDDTSVQDNHNDGELDGELVSSQQTATRSFDDDNMEENEEEEEETPASSSPDIINDAEQSIHTSALKELSQPRGLAKNLPLEKNTTINHTELGKSHEGDGGRQREDDDVDEDKDDEVIIPTMRTQRSRGGFIFDSDDE